MKTVVCKCAHCRNEFTARVADRKRGWAKFCSKSCKAKEQEQRTGRFRELVLAQDHAVGMAALEAGWDGHKNVF